MAAARPRLLLALWAARGAAALSSTLGRGAATALPGLLAERIDPHFVSLLGRSLEGGAVLVTGTNGKTTTARLLAGMLAAAGRPPSTTARDPTSRAASPPPSPPPPTGAAAPASGAPSP